MRLACLWRASCIAGQCAAVAALPGKVPLLAESAAPMPVNPGQTPLPESSRPRPVPQQDVAAVPAPVFKSRGGLRRVSNAFGYSRAGVLAAVRHEAAFRQELALGLPLMLAAPFLAPGRWQLLAMVGSIVLVWIVELLNSAVEALADAVSADHHPLLGRAKDLGSAAVMCSLALAALTWLLALWP